MRKGLNPGPPARKSRESRSGGPFVAGRGKRRNRAMLLYVGKSLVFAGLMFIGGFVPNPVAFVGRGAVVVLARGKMKRSGAIKAAFGPFPADFYPLRGQKKHPVATVVQRLTHRHNRTFRQ